MRGLDKRLLSNRTPSGVWCWSMSATPTHKSWSVDAHPIYIHSYCVIVHSWGVTTWNIWKKLYIILNLADVFYFFLEQCYHGILLQAIDALGNVPSSTVYTALMDAVSYANFYYAVRIQAADVLTKVCGYIQCNFTWTENLPVH